MFKIHPSSLPDVVYVYGDRVCDPYEYGYLAPSNSAEMRSWFSAEYTPKQSPASGTLPTIEGVYRTEIRVCDGVILSRDLEIVKDKPEFVFGWSYWSDGQWYAQSHTFAGAFDNFKNRRKGTQPRFWVGLTAHGYEESVKTVINKSLFNGLLIGARDAEILKSIKHFPPINPSFGCVTQFQKGGFTLHSIDRAKVPRFVQYTIDVPLETSDVFEVEVIRISKPLNAKMIKKEAK
ncbi:hypothetical protein [Burkholderia phage BCSR52]|uniref:Uncharacterized protein n=1 Tax=Burkholderia phage BCSR52 TaxID=2805748 RepID=A0A889IPX5_9CAUD|nr:hypothetical protein [Burkholderia phage BCSR52]